MNRKDQRLLERVANFVAAHGDPAIPLDAQAPPDSEPESESHFDIEESSAAVPESVEIGRHARKCSICRHPDRAEIELEFVRWRSPAGIAESYKLRDRSSIFRHAHAFGLFDARGRNLCASLDTFIERAENIHITPDAVVQAVRTRARINANGEWFNPTSTHRVIVSAPATPPASSEPPQLSTPRPRLPENSNRNCSRLENDATR